MMNEFGTVKHVHGITAIVSVDRKSSCEQCAAGCTLSDSGANIEAVNRVEAKVGQKVRVAIRPYAYLKGSLIVYGLPAMALVAGAVAGKEILSGFFPAYDPDIVSAFAGFGAFAVSFLIVKLWSMGLEKKLEYKPVIEEIIEE